MFDGGGFGGLFGRILTAKNAGEERHDFFFLLRRGILTWLPGML